MSKFKSVAVFCASSPGITEVYLQQAAALGKIMAEENITLIYGGGNIGLMGSISTSVLENNGRAIGVIPTSLAPREISGETKAEMIEVPDMHTRKLRIYKEAEAFIALPGGFGTFEELFEVITWQQLGIHKKPIGLLNVDNFYDPLLKLIENAVSEKFILKDFADQLQVSNDPKELLQKLQNLELVDSKIKWAEESTI